MKRTRNSRNGDPAKLARREPRIQHLSELHLSYEGADREIPIRLPDISPHGIFVNTSTHFPEGAIVNLRFRLSPSSVEIRTRGEVRYCLSGVGIGAEFVGMPPETVRAIEKELREAPRPRRACTGRSVRKR
jgi:PilZ domain